MIKRLRFQTEVSIEKEKENDCLDRTSACQAVSLGGTLLSVVMATSWSVAASDDETRKRAFNLCEHAFCLNFLECLSYVCPEPVLVKRSFLVQSAFSYRSSPAPLTARPNVRPVHCSSAWMEGCRRRSPVENTGF